MSKNVNMMFNSRDEKALFAVQQHAMSKLQKTVTGTNAVRFALNMYWQAIDLGIIDDVQRLIEQKQAERGGLPCWVIVEEKVHQ